MGKAISVKVPTAKVIKALEDALVVREQRFADNEKSEAEYRKAQVKYKADLMKLVKSPKARVTDATHFAHYATRNNAEQEINITICIPRELVPAEPERAECYLEWEYKRDVEEIGNALRLLRMTDDQYVNASTMAKVSQYL